VAVDLNIDLELYRIFCTAAETGSFSAAAKRLYITQPAVSQAIQKLEESFDTRLFNRAQRGVTLTGEGEMLYGYAVRALSLLTEGEKKLRRIGELSGGELRIGAGDTVSKWYLLKATSVFHKLYPEVSLSIINRTSSETVKLLLEGKIDIGFVNLPMNEPGVVFEECITVHDVFVAGEKFSELKDRVLTLGEIARCPLIMLERASNSRRQVDRYFMTKGIDLSPQIELGAHDLLCDYARIGLGIACVTREFTDHDENSGLFEIKLDTPVPERSIGVCYTENTELSAAAKRYIELVMSSDIDD